jgi:hypothetical protein
VRAWPPISHCFDVEGHRTSRLSVKNVASVDFAPMLRRMKNELGEGSVGRTSDGEDMYRRREAPADVTFVLMISSEMEQAVLSRNRTTRQLVIGIWKKWSRFQEKAKKNNTRAISFN